MEGSFEDNNEISVSGGGEFLIRWENYILKQFVSCSHTLVCGIIMQNKQTSKESLSTPVVVYLKVLF
jgi:hypothetical protein